MLKKKSKQMESVEERGSEKKEKKRKIRVKIKEFVKPQVKNYVCSLFHCLLTVIFPPFWDEAIV